MVSSLILLWALAGSSVTPVGAQLMFPRGTGVPRSVQEFAWRIIETHCNYQPYERVQRSFWVYDARARRIDGGIVYSIGVVSDVAWRKREPPAVIEMTVTDDGGVRLTALRSSFIACAP